MKPMAKERIKTCVECGNSFYTKGKKKLCTKECARIYNARKSRERYKPSKEVMQRPKECVVCNSTFTPNASNQICCSPECSEERGRQRALIHSRTYAVKKFNRAPLPESMECPQCGVKFKPLHRGRKYCSDKCAHKSHVLRKRANRPKPIVPCAVCGVEFEQDHGLRKYCSEKCAYSVVLEQQAKWRFLNVKEEEEDDYESELLLWDDGSNDNYWLDNEEWLMDQGRLNRASMMLPPIGPPPEWACAPMPPCEPRVPRAGEVESGARVRSPRELLAAGVGRQSQLAGWRFEIPAGMLIGVKGDISWKRRFTGDRRQALDVGED